VSPARILVAEAAGYAPAAREILEGLGPVVLADLDRAGLLAALDGVQVLIVRLRNRIDEEVLAAAPALRVVVTATTGLDHIDLEAAARRGVTVLSLRGETDFLETVTATAEHTWGLLLALVRHIPRAAAAAAAGVWERDRFRGRELRGRRLGIVGLGRLGRMVARYGAAFAMDVAAHDPFAGAWLEGVARCDTLAELLDRSDVLSLHVPLDERTRGLIGAAELGRLPAGALLVNTSRGGVVDEAALLDALRSGRLAGAALDVVQGETVAGAVAGSLLVRHARENDNLLLTPHIGGATLESMQNTEIFMAGKLARFLRGEPVRTDAPRSRDASVRASGSAPPSTSAPRP